VDPVRLPTAPLAVYGNQIPRPDPPVRLLELPTHRDVRDLLLARVYFLEGARQLSLFTTTPVDQWVDFLQKLPDRAVWFVSPDGPPDVGQARRYESALKTAGFTKVRGVPNEFTGYPPTKLTLWKRTRPAS